MSTPAATEPRDATAGAPRLRTFVIDGEERTDTTYRTRLIELYTQIEGRSFLDLGAADGYESRAVALRGAARAVAVEGKESAYVEARAAQDYLALPNHEVLQLDVRRIDEHGLGEFDVVLCFGLLYHMVNPYNLLKRIRNVTGDLLLLETHVAPLTMKGLHQKHGEALPYGLYRVELDGVEFEGKVVTHLGDFAKTKGSLDSPWSFWLTIESLVKAVTLAGFAIEDYHFEPHSASPEAVSTWGGLLGFGHANTKVWLAASARKGARGRPGEPSDRVVVTPRRTRPPLLPRVAGRVGRSVPIRLVRRH
jgi:SAM-dependent methyltransferase